MSLKKQPEGSTFVCLLPSTESEKKLREFCQTNGITQSVEYDGSPLKGLFEFHLTIYYAKWVTKATDGIFEIDPLFLPFKEFTFLGMDKDILTLELVKSETLDTIKDFYKQVYGLDSEWAKFIPHVSLSYDKGQVKPSNVIDGIIFDKLKIVTKVESALCVKENVIRKILGEKND